MSKKQNTLIVAALWAAVAFYAFELFMRYGGGA